MIKVCSIVNVKEVNGVEPKAGDGPGIAVKSHQNNSGLVVLAIGEREYTVTAADIEAAVANARNSNRFG